MRGVWGGGLYDRSAIVSHEELARSFRVQGREVWRTRSPVPPTGPPGELQVQGLVQGEHDDNLLTSHLHKQSGRDRVTPSSGPKRESWDRFYNLVLGYYSVFRNCKKNVTPAAVPTWGFV